MRLRRGAGLALALILFACLVSAGGLLFLWAMLGREPAVAPQSTLVIKLAGDLGDGGPEDMVGQLLPVVHPPSVRAVVDNLRKAARDRRISSVLVVPNGLSSPYWAKLQEVRAALAEFRKSGKPAWAFLEYGGQPEYALATACDRVFLLPTSPLDLRGIASEELFLRGLFDKVGAVPDMVHVGDYKTATNQLTQKTFTPAHREMAESLANDLFDQLAQAVADGRRKPASEVRSLIDDGPFLPEDALRTGLVDDLAYEDEVMARLKPGGGAPARIDLDEYARVSPASAGFIGGPRIGVIYVTGTITSGASGFAPMSGPTAGSDTIVRFIRRVRDDASIRALVLRVDSPGGSAVASDVIWRELKLFREAKPSRPLVVSMSDLAASGGYYIAMAAPTIVAAPGTLTGSIGIFGGKIATGGAFAKLGINIEGVKAGQNAAMDSSARPFSPSERAKVEEQLQAFYEQFIEKAAASRGMTPERLDRVAQGRVWTGRQARELKLVDELGGLETAVGLARQKAGIPASASVDLVVYPPRRTLYDLITAQLAGGPMDARFGWWPAVATRGLAGMALLPGQIFRPGEPLALMGY